MTEKNMKKETNLDNGESYTDINKAWDKDNQAWWDWYVSLANNPTTKQAFIKLPNPPQTKYSSIHELKKELSNPYKISKSDVQDF